jgi:hypothetical protein
MKLAEALLERADIQKRIALTAERLKRVALVQEGVEPAEDPAELRVLLDELLTRLQFLMSAINHTNAQTEVTPGLRTTDALAQRDVLKLRLMHAKAVLDVAQLKVDRYSKTEIRFLPTLDVKELQAEYDTYARRLRELDARIQEANWKTELLLLAGQPTKIQRHEKLPEAENSHPKPIKDKKPKSKK